MLVMNRYAPRVIGALGMAALGTWAFINRKSDVRRATAAVASPVPFIHIDDDVAADIIKRFLPVLDAALRQEQRAKAFVVSG